MSLSRPVNATKIKGKTVDDAAIADSKVLMYKSASGKIEYAAVAGTGDMLKSTYDVDADNVVDNAKKLDGNTLTQVRTHAPAAHTHPVADLTDHNKAVHDALSIAPAAHTHVEADITNLDHNAQKIKSKTVDDAAIADGKVLMYKSASGKIEYATPSGAGDMLKSTYDTDDDGTVETAKVGKGIEYQTTTTALSAYSPTGTNFNGRMVAVYSTHATDGGFAIFGYLNSGWHYVELM